MKICLNHQVLVLGGIGSVLASLVVLFLVYYAYLWRTWDSNKRDHQALNNAAAAAEEEIAALYADLDGGCDLMNTALLNSRRKSVSFAVCRASPTPTSMSVGPATAAAVGSTAAKAAEAGSDNISIDITHFGDR